MATEEVKEPQPTMVYKFPGTMHTDNVTKDSFDYKIVDGDEVEKACEDGWFETPAEARTAFDNSTPVTRAEMEMKATELDIDFDDDTEDEVLLSAIEEKLKSSNGFFNKVTSFLG